MWEILENKYNQQKDVLIIALPYVDTKYSLAAPAFLKPCVERIGLSCLAVDANITALHLVKNSQFKDKWIDFFYSNKIYQEIEEELYNYLNTFIEKILSWNPKWVAFSLLTSDNQNIARWLLYFLRKRNSQIKIIVGGSGCGISAAELGNFIPEMFERKLIDYHIRGDGEISLVELLKGNTEYPGINGIPGQFLTDQQIQELPDPDYSDYDLSQWDDKTVTIVGSRGCVRNCSFCDFIEYHTKFQWRSAEDIFNEMLRQSEKFQVQKFNFADSLVNGNVKVFNQLITLLADYNNKNPDKKFSWAGFYIIRNKSSTDEWTWKTLKESGAKILSIGIESFSQTVRYELGKKIDDDAVLHHFYLAQKYGVKVLALLLVGYPNETQEDVLNSIAWIKNNKSLSDTVIFTFSTVAISPGTQLDRIKSKYGVIIDENKRESSKSRIWATTQYNHVNDFLNREKWLLAYQEACKESGFITSRDWSDLIDHYQNKIVEKYVDPRKIMEDLFND